MIAEAFLMLLLVGSGSDLVERALDLARLGSDRVPGSLQWIDKDLREREASYLVATREVTNWRLEALGALEPLPVLAATLLAQEQAAITRCVKLNNYWCIKSARWNGEIGADDEGHVGFASAERGADAAAALLRRYYLEFGRKSAIDIVRRWAPAECNVVSPSGAPAVLAVKGIGNTLRARYLASRRRLKVSGRTRNVRVSAVIPRATPTFRVPDIAAGMGERKVATLSASLPPVAAAGPPAPRPAPTLACAPDEVRLRNYAAHIVEGLDLKPTDDLNLFAPDGTPLPNLVRVMLAMSSFELGYLRASVVLVEGAIARAALRAEARSAAQDGSGAGARQDRPSMAD